jgi:hypothetical protein
LAPTFGGDDFIWISGPDERLGLMIGLFDEAVDGGLEIDDRNTPRLSRRRLSLAKKPSTALSHFTPRSA